MRLFLNSEYYVIIIYNKKKLCFIDFGNKFSVDGLSLEITLMSLVLNLKQLSIVTINSMYNIKNQEEFFLGTTIAISSKYLILILSLQ